MMVVKGEEKDKDRVGVLRRRWGGVVTREKRENWKEEKYHIMGERKPPRMGEKSSYGGRNLDGASLFFRSFYCYTR